MIVSGSNKYYSSAFYRLLPWVVVVHFELAVPLCAQQNYTFTSINNENGLAHNNVFEIFQDKEGFIWLGAGSHLQRFDGKNFITFEYEVGNNSTISFGDVRSVIQDTEETIWVGLDGGGISLLKDGKFSTLKKGSVEGFSANVIEQIIQISDGSFYIASWDAGLISYKNGQFRQFVPIPGDTASLPNNTVVSLYYDQDDKRLWVGTWGGGLCYMEGDRVFRVPVNEKGFNSPNARVIEKGPDGNIWVGSWGKGLFRLKDNKYEPHNVANGHLENDNVLTLKRDGDKLWIGTWGGGVTLYENETFTTFRHNPEQKNTISSDFIESALIDSRGNLIIGTFGGGITTFEKSFFQHHTFSKLNGDNASNFTNSIVEDGYGRIWVATNGGIFIEDEGNFRPIRELYPQIPDAKPVYELYRAKNNDIWIGGGTGVGLFQFDGKKVVNWSEWSNIDFKDYFIHDIIESEDKSLWISADIEAGLIQLKRDTVIRYLHDPADESTIPTNNLYDSFISADGTLWICSNRRGVMTFKNDVFKKYLASNDLENSLSNNYAYSILESKTGDIWVGTEFGLNRYNEASDGFDSYFKEDGLLDNTILSLAEDHSGNIWIGTHRGVSRLDPVTMTFQNFDRRNGIEGYPFNKRAIYHSPSTGKIYIGGVNGLTIFHPDSVSLIESPQVKITNLIVNNQSVFFGNDSLLAAPMNGSSPIELKRFEGSITFHYSDMSFGRGEELQYEYRINDLEGNWNTVINEVRAVYSNISPGTHTFEVRSSRDGYNWGEADSITFHISPYWWETTAFKFMMVLFIAGVIFTLVYGRIAFLKKQKKRLERQVNAKTQEIQLKNQKITENSEALERSNADLKKALIKIKRHEDQLISFQENEREAIKREVHDSISTSLFAIRFMIGDGLKKIKEGDAIFAAPTLVDDLLNRVIKDSRIILNNLSMKNGDQHASFFDSLNDLIDRSDKLSETNISLDWEGAHQIEMLDVSSNIFRIIQDGLANTLQHAEAKRAIIKFNNSETAITWSLEDDGVGFKLNGAGFPGNKGLHRMHERAEEVNGELKVQSEPEKGTSVSFSMTLCEGTKKSV